MLNILFSVAFDDFILYIMQNDFRIILMFIEYKSNMADWPIDDEDTQTVRNSVNVWK